MDAAAKIIEFGRLLRSLGMKVSSAELIDACNALLFVDWTKPSQVEIALQATLVKKQTDMAVFCQAYDSFFKNDRISEITEQNYVERLASKQESIAKADDELLFQGNALSIPDTLKEVYGRIPEKDQARLRSFLEKTSQGHLVESKFQPLVEKMLTGSLEYWRRLLAEEEVSYSRQPTGDPKTDAIVEEILRQVHDDHSLLYKDMQRISDAEIPLMCKLVKRMAKLLATQISRRQRASKHKVALDVRKSIRDNLRYGGAVFSIRYKAPHKHKPDIMLLCDVSGSMARYAMFVLQFIFGLSSLLSNVESFIFAEEVERVSPYFRKRKSFAQIMSQLMITSPQWGRGTNLRKSLQDIVARYPHTLQSSTVLIIVSDTKTVQSEAAAAELAHVGSKVKSIIWLNTLPRSEWSQSNAVTRFQAVSHMVPCNTLADLMKIVQSEVLQMKKENCRKNAKKSLQ